MKTVESIRAEILANKKPEACETYQNANGICSKCGWEQSAHRPYSERQAEAQLASIREMVANLTEEGAIANYVGGLDRNQLENIATKEVGFEQGMSAETAKGATEDELREDVILYIKNGDYTPPDFEWDEEQARETIQEDPLEIQVRGDWHTPGDEDGNRATEFYILLCTGGPAVRLVGDLDEHMQPERVRIEHQDWGTPWTQLFNISDESREAMLTYCSQFYFGE